MVERVVRRRRAEPKPQKGMPKLGKPGKDVEMLIRFSPYGGEVVDWFELSKEVQGVLDKHFGTRFVDRNGVVLHVGIIIAKTGG